MSIGMDVAARFLIVAGIVLVVVGGAILLAGRLGLPTLGRLPGDFSFHRDGLSIYVPIATSIILSLVLTIVLNLIGRFGR